MNKEERIKCLRERLTLATVKHDIEILKVQTLKEAHVYCVIHRLAAQQYGPLLEKFLRTKFGYVKNKAEACTGDCSKGGKNAEVKVSLGGSTYTKFNYVQIRPTHDCEDYLFTAYHLSPENIEEEGELYLFKVPKADIKTLIVAHGGYAHGTVKELGPITVESINDGKIKEYALRPALGDACWRALLPFRIPEGGL